MIEGPYGARDQAVSVFAAILGRLCYGMPAHAAAFVDAEGETVDYAGRRKPYDIRVMAAELRLLLGHCAEGHSHEGAKGLELVVRARGASYAAIQLDAGYALVVELRRRAFVFSRRALSEGIHELCAEAELTIPPQFARERWTRVDVNEDNTRARRPTALWGDHSWLAVEVIGRYYGHDLAMNERGYRVRVHGGSELTLVREPWGCWYAEHPVLESKPPPGR